MCIELLRSIPERFQINSKDRWFSMMMAISCIFMTKMLWSSVHETRHGCWEVQVGGLDSKTAPGGLGMCTESLRSLPERFQTKSKNRWFSMMMAISWILMDFDRFWIRIKGFTNIGPILVFDPLLLLDYWWSLARIQLFCPKNIQESAKTHTETFLGGFWALTSLRCSWLTQIGSESLSAD